MKYVKSCLIITMLLGVGYSQCNESNWEEYYPEMAFCALEGATLSNGADDAGNAGVVVSDIERGAPAARIGLQSDDVIIGVNRVRTSTVAEFRNALDEAKGVIALNVKRGNSTLYLVIRQ